MNPTSQDDCRKAECMASIICMVSAQCTQNIFLRLDPQKRGYLDQLSLERALVGLSRYEITELFVALDHDKDQRISPHELNLAILDWLTESSSIPISTSFASLLALYGLDEEINLKPTADARQHTANDHSYARIGYAR
jgi:Ca2+-binding EF-hand superfamily protein